jgi:hypothetical protein
MQASLLSASLFALISGLQNIEYKQAITNTTYSDGFGSQFQAIIATAIYAELNNYTYVYTPFKDMEHNYDNDPHFLAKKEKLINFIDNFKLNNGSISNTTNAKDFFDKNVTACANSSVLQKIKKIFRANKVRTHYFDNQHVHIAMHVRRHNQHDNRIMGTDIPDQFFLNIITKLRILYSSKKLLFHIYSQGNRENFSSYHAPDIMLHLNESVEDTFTPMVLADVLVTSPSSFSYAAGILSDGIVYYIPFWHKPLPHWLAVDTL